MLLSVLLGCVSPPSITKVYHKLKLVSSRNGGIYFSSLQEPINLIEHIRIRDEMPVRRNLGWMTESHRHV